MPRTRTGFTRHRRHKKVLSRTKGFRGTNTRLYKRAREADLHAGQYAYVGRKLRKRNFRSLWILRITAALQSMGGELNYSRFINLAKKANVSLDRKILSDIAATDFNTFKTIVAKVRG
jgi:large subunit ribosomal protein L20